MTKDSTLERSFYMHTVQQVARHLLGQRLVHNFLGERISGFIIETEAYDGEEDQACHARSGKTKRNSAMYEQGGHAYVYFTYGMHWMFNCVCGPVDYPAAVLIRAILPIENLDFIRKRRVNIPQKHWCDGPAKLTKAMAIDGSMNGFDLCDEHSNLNVCAGITIPDSIVQTSPRIGIQNSGEPWVSLPWRYFIRPEDMRARLGI